MTASAAQTREVIRTAVPYIALSYCGAFENTTVHQLMTASTAPMVPLKHSTAGHTQGGLIARYAIGKLYDPRDRLVAGLRPAHYMSIAAPHLGCDGFSGPAQVTAVLSEASQGTGLAESQGFATHTAV